MKRIIYFLVIICISILPKINIISIEGSTAGIRIEDLLMGLLCIYYIENIFVKKKIVIDNLKMKKIIRVFLWYIIITLISSVLGIFGGYVKPYLAIFYFFRKIEYFIMIFVGYDIIKNNICTEDKIEKFFSFTVIFHFVISLLQLSGKVGSFNRGQVLDYMTQGRVSSTFNGAYELSAYLLLILPYFLYNILKTKRQIIKNFIYITIIVLCICYSESRTSLIVLVSIIILMFLKFEKKINVKVLGVNILFLTVLLANFYNVSINLQETRFSSLNIEEMIATIKNAWYTKNFDNYVATGSWYGNYNIKLSQEADASYSARVYHWMQLMDGFLRNPLLGVGASISGGAADGNYVRILAESGILGIAIWGYMNYVIIKNTKEKLYENKTIAVTRYALISMLLGAIFIDVFEASKVMMIMWFLVGMSYAVQDKYFESENNGKEKYD